MKGEADCHKVLQRHISLSTDHHTSYCQQHVCKIRFSLSVLMAIFRVILG